MNEHQKTIGVGRFFTGELPKMLKLTFNGILSCFVKEKAIFIYFIRVGLLRLWTLKGERREMKTLNFPRKLETRAHSAPIFLRLFLIHKKRKELILWYATLSLWPFSHHQQRQNSADNDDDNYDCYNSIHQIIWCRKACDCSWCR